MNEAELARVTGAEPLDWEGTERFEVLRCIGRGGMGTVYEARDRHTLQSVALKTLVHYEASSFYLFKQEFRALSGVSHPNLVRLYELFGTEGDRVFFSMELVRGTDFLAHVRRVGAVLRVDDSTGGSSAEGPSRVRMAGAAPREPNDKPPPLARSSIVQPSPADLDRLLPSLRQLVEGVHAVHCAGKLHRDIKPSNVLVTPDGRVVVLDFGVATDVPRIGEEMPSEDMQMVGTARYMAPEQGIGEPPTPAADWYSVGVMLFESLVGSAPFNGTIFEVIQAKNALDAPSPRELVAGVPPELDALCRDLLARSPLDRPTGVDILRRLGVSRSTLRAAPYAAEARETIHLVGRREQVAALDEAFAAVRGGRGVTVQVSGLAGMGKSALLEHVLDDWTDHKHAVVLRGRAYQRESLRYKAVDSIIDALSRHLIHLADNEATFPLPADVGALAHLFPVLRRVPTIEQPHVDRVPDPAQMRRRAFGALRTLLATLAKRRPLVLCIDDAQWGDTDSVALLTHIVRPPHPPALLLLLAYRDEEAQAAPFVTDLHALWPSGAEVRDVQVGPLNPEDSRGLALSLLGPVRSTHKLADAVVRESGGSPFLIEELARGAVGRLEASSDARVTIEEVVEDRLAELPDTARQALEVVAVAGRPMPLSTLRAAVGAESIDEVVALLSSRRFVRSELRDGRDVTETTHDRLRETIVARLPAATVQEHHSRLAQVLEATPGADPESLAHHLLGAGETERAGRFAHKAAEQAAKLLAFDQAARLFRLAIATLPDSPKFGRLYARLGEVLQWAGRNEESGRAYIVAAERASGAERSGFERAAAAQLIAAGRIDEGGMMLRRVLAGAGVDVPASPFATVASLVATKLRLRVGGLRFKERDPSAIPATEGARLDAMHVAAMGLASVDNLLAACMQARQFMEALRVGDRARIVRAGVIYFGSHLSLQGGPVSAHERAVQDLVRRLVEKGGRPEEVAFLEGTHGVGLFVRGRWREAVQMIDHAYANLPGQQAGMQAQAALYAAYAQAFLGDLIELRQRRARLLVDAEQRGDLFMTVLLSVSHPVLLWLADDDPKGAKTLIHEAKARWSHGKFLIQDWQVMRSEAEVDLYAGDGSAAHARLVRDEAAVKESMLLRSQYLRVLTSFARARAAILSVASEPERRPVRLAEARKLARELRHEKMAWVEPLAAIVEACVSNTEGDRARASVTLKEAATLAQAANMALYAAAARHQLGRLLGKGYGGTDLVREAEEVMRAQDVRQPARFAGMYVPGQWGAPTS